MAAPWLSVAMPVHCGMTDLHATLASVAAQRPDGVEFLIYDSTPDYRCRGVVERFVDRLSIRYRAMPEVRSWPAKTNLAVEHAGAPHVAMLHQDDIWLRGHIASAARRLRDAPDAVMHIAPARLIDSDGRDIGRWSPPMPPSIRDGMDFGRRLMVQNFVAIPTPIIRRDAWLKAGGMDADLWYTADWDLYLKLAQIGRIAIGSDATTAFRIHGKSLTMTGSRNAQGLGEQLDIVLMRHGAAFGFETDSRLRARAEVSARVNTCLAAAASGHTGAVLPALSQLLRLGPVDCARYLRDSRLMDRLLPRLRLKLRGAL